ncbi:MAG: hypothetical protein GY944_00470 [bacterium]|nr:hypothetical protein [bacterium]
MRRSSDEYQSLGIERVIVGVAMDMWGQPEKIMPLLDEFAELLPQLK